MIRFKSGMSTGGITHLATNTLPILVIQSVFPLLPLSTYIYCHSPLSTDTNLQKEAENSFLPLHQGVCLLSDTECLSNDTALGFYHDSLNSLNSKKVI